MNFPPSRQHSPIRRTIHHPTPLLRHRRWPSRHRPALAVLWAALLVGPIAQAELPEEEATGESELAPLLDSNRQPLGPDPLVLPQWTPVEADARRLGRPVNLGGGLWSDERFPLEPSAPLPPPTLHEPPPALPLDEAALRLALQLPLPQPLPPATTAPAVMQTQAENTGQAMVAAPPMGHQNIPAENASRPWLRLLPLAAMLAAAGAVLALRQRGKGQAVGESLAEPAAEKDTVS